MRTRLATLLLALLIPAVAHAGLVQQMATPVSNPTSPSTLTLPANSTIGNLLTVTCVTRDSSGSIGPVPTITGLATTWTQQVDSGAGVNDRALIWTGVATSAGTSVSAAFSGGTSPKVACSVQEWTAYTTLDQSGTTTSSLSTTITSPSLTTTQAVEMVLLVGGHNSGVAASASPGAPWVTLNGTSGTVPQLNAVYQITSATGSYSGTWTWAAAADNGSAGISMYVPGSNPATASVSFQ